MTCDKCSLAASNPNQRVKPKDWNKKEKNAPGEMQIAQKAFARKERRNPDAMPKSGKPIKESHLKFGRDS